MVRPFKVHMWWVNVPNSPSEFYPTPILLIFFAISAQIRVGRSMGLGMAGGDGDGDGGLEEV